MIQLNRIYKGDCIDVMKKCPENFVDTIITDPPYGIRFMGKAWDGEDIEKMVQTKRRKNTLPPGGRHGMVRKDGRAFAAGTYDQSIRGNLAFQEWCTDWAKAALRIAKPGATMLVFGGTRTFHRMAAGLEDAGWQIRDCMMWLYGSGFPKSHNLRGKFEGWGTALKPAWEPIIVAMKPLNGTFAENADKWGVAGINVDGGRISTNEIKPPAIQRHGGIWSSEGDRSFRHNGSGTSNTQGRWPANLILDEEAAAMLDGQSGELKSGDHQGFKRANRGSYSGAFPEFSTFQREGDSSGASRFFYVAKSSRRERNDGCETSEPKPSGMKNSSGRNLNGDYETRPSANIHPTVKPLLLMKYLCQLTKTPTGGIVLDPFAGTGTTLIACESLGRPWLGIEMNSEYIDIANARIDRERVQMKMAI